ncbi:MAG: aminoglycoside phosphotransferase family protein [Desulfopila sp.]|nr:aminoglycoside phosphotransferase family protein [Desulfopila sp.]
MKPDSDQLQRAIRRFSLSGNGSFTVRPVGSGHINDSYLVSFAHKRFILQRINHKVFKEPHKVARNSALVSSHLRANFLRFQADVECIPEILAAEGGERYWRDEAGDIWRAQSYIANSFVHERIEKEEQAIEVGRCLAAFHEVIADLALTELEVVLPDFHNLPGYLQKYDAAIAAAPADLTAKLGQHRECIDRYRPLADFFPRAMDQGDVVQQLVHGDPKVSNILFDGDSGRAVSMIDLDTVGPGLVLFDVGDCLRSAAFLSAEDDTSSEGSCDISLLAAFLQGYLEKKSLSRFELDHIFEAFLLITFELGVRFLTDYLQGNWYFKVMNEEDNLHRAVTQFRRVAGIEGQRREITEAVAGCVAKVKKSRTGKK